MNSVYKFNKLLFIFYEDLESDASQKSKVSSDVPEEKKEVFSLLFESVEALQRENVSIVWSSIVKETMKRKRPSFSEGIHGYKSFSALLEDAQARGLLKLRKDERSGSYIIMEFGHKEIEAGVKVEAPKLKPATIFGSSKMIHMITAPRMPIPTTLMPMTPPLEKAMRRALLS